MMNEHLRKYTVSLQFGFVIDLWIWNSQQRLVIHLSRIVRGRLILFIKFDSNDETPVTQGIQQGIQSTGEESDSESSYPESLPDLVPIPTD